MLTHASLTRNFSTQSVYLRACRFFRPFRSSVIFWGAGAGFAVSLFLSSVPLFKKDVLQKIPVVRLVVL